MCHIYLDILRRAQSLAVNSDSIVQRKMFFQYANKLCSVDKLLSVVNEMFNELPNIFHSVKTDTFNVWN